MKNLQLVIASGKLKTFYSEFAKLVKMSEKMGLPTPTNAVTSKEQRTVRFYDPETAKFCNNSSYIIDVFVIEIEIAETLKFNGWSLVATVHHREDVVDLVNIEDELPSKYGCGFTVCEHCNHSHSNRVLSFIVRNENGEFKQVGSTCIDQFLGVNPNQLCKLNEQLIIVLSDSFSEDDEEEKFFNQNDDSSWVLKRKAYDIKSIFQVALEVLTNNDFKYVKKITSQSDHYPYETYRTNKGEATVELMEDVIDAEGFISKDVDETYYNSLVSFLETMEVQPPKYDEEESFTEKVQSIYDATKIRRMDFWRVVWAILMYKSSLEMSSKSNLHIGTVDEKSVIECIIIDFKTGCGNYGDWQLFIMEDKDGNSINKFGTIGNQFIINQPNQDWIGTMVKFTATIKSHEVKNKRNVTMLGRLSKAK